MRIWNLDDQSPFSLKLSADVRESTPDYANDHTWEVKLSGGAPAALALETSYGLRARLMRIFAAFCRAEQEVMAPQDFKSAPVVETFFPNYVSIRFAAFRDIDVRAEFWVPDSQRVAGRFSFQNTGSEEVAVALKLFAVLHPGANAEVMSVLQQESVRILAGATGDINPVLFLSGGAHTEQAAYPGLVVSASIPAGAIKRWTWVQAAGSTLEESFESARNQVRKSWDAEIARIEILNSAQIQVETGDPDWDAAIAFSQKVALGSMIGSTSFLPHASYVNGRLGDSGYSEEGRGRDYDQAWNGQSVFDTLQLMDVLKYASPALTRGLLLNYFHLQGTDGFIDQKPGLAGQRSGLLCAPLLAVMVWKYYQHTGEIDLLERLVDPLLRFHKNWFQADHDHDQDGWPEWDHVIHAGFENWPSFARWHSWAQGAEVSKAETVDLLSYLIVETRSMQAILTAVGRKEESEHYAARLQLQLDLMQAAWRDDLQGTRHRDRDGHESPAGTDLGLGQGVFQLELDRKSPTSQRVLIRVNGEESLARSLRIHIHGRGKRGRTGVEKLDYSHVQWFWEYGTATSAKLYSYIEKIEVLDCDEKIEISFRTVDYERADITQLLPLWADALNTGQAQQLVQGSILNPERYWCRAGLPLCSLDDSWLSHSGRERAGTVSILWNSMIGEGLLAYGYPEEAAELLQRIMQPIIQGLRQEHAFRAVYDASDLSGKGSFDAISGLAPLSFILKVAGLELYSPTKLKIFGKNHLPWPVQISWQGLAIVRDTNSADITFPDGQTRHIEGEEACMITLQQPDRFHGEGL